MSQIRDRFITMSQVRGGFIILRWVHYLGVV